MGSSVDVKSCHAMNLGITDYGSRIKCNTAIYIFLLIILPVQAIYAQDHSWNFRFYAAALDSGESAYTNTTSIGTGTEFINSYSVDMGNGDGFGLSAEHLLLNRRLGLEFGVLFADIETELLVGITGGTGGDRQARTVVDSGFESLYFGANYHFFNSGEWYDLYAGASLNYVHYSNSRVTVDGAPGVFNIEDDMGYGLALGFDAKFGKSRRWRITSGLRYLFTETLFSFSFETTDGGTSVAPVNVEVNPVILQLGLGYSF